MFDFHTRVALKPLMTAKTSGGCENFSSKQSSRTSSYNSVNSGGRTGQQARRSSVAVMAGGSAAILTSSKTTNKEGQRRHYFERWSPCALNYWVLLFVDDSPDSTIKFFFVDKIENITSQNCTDFLVFYHKIKTSSWVCTSFTLDFRFGKFWSWLF